MNSPTSTETTTTKKPKKAPTRPSPSPKKTTSSTTPPAFIDLDPTLSAQGLLRPLENTMPFCKWGFFGDVKSGKRFTAVVAGLGLHRLVNSRLPLSFFDTSETARLSIEQLKAAKVAGTVTRSRSLTDFAAWIAAGEAGAFDVGIINSVTHLHEDLMAGYRRRQGVDDLGPADWSAINSAWHTGFSSPFRASRLHLILVGRAADDYGAVVDADGKQESVKTGVRLRAERQTGYDPELLVRMERLELAAGGVVRRAIVVGDCRAQVDGRSFDNPTFADFAAVAKATIKDGVDAAPIEQASTAELFSDNRDQRREVKRLIVDIENVLGREWSKATPAGREKRARALVASFGTATWERLEAKRAVELAAGLATLRQFIADGGPTIDMKATPAPAEAVRRIREGLTDAAVVEAAAVAGVALQVARNRALYAARSVVDALAEPHRTDAERCVADAAKRWAGGNGSGGGASSGGRARALADTIVPDDAH